MSWEDVPYDKNKHPPTDEPGHKTAQKTQTRPKGAHTRKPWKNNTIPHLVQWPASSQCSFPRACLPARDASLQTPLFLYRRGCGGIAIFTPLLSGTKGYFYPAAKAAMPPSYLYPAAKRLRPLLFIPRC